MPARLAAAAGRNNTRLEQLRELSALHKREDITLNSETEIYGANGTVLFSEEFEDALIGLSIARSYHPWLDWIGWNPSTVIEKNRGYITYAAVAGTAAGTPGSAAITTQCTPGAQAEFGTFKYKVSGFAEMRLSSPPRNALDTGLKKNERTQMFRIDRTPITSESEFDALITAAAMLEEFHTLAVTGNHTSNAGQPNGVKTLIDYGYTDVDNVRIKQMDSHVVDWKGLSTSGAVSDPNGTSITYNGANVPAGTYSLFRILENLVIRIKGRIRAANMVSNMLNAGDVVLQMPDDWIDEFLQMAACYTRCGGDFGKLTTEAAGQFIENAYNSAANVPLANAIVNIKGVPVYIVGYDWGLINSDGTADWLLQFKPQSPIPSLFGEFAPGTLVERDFPNDFVATDGGRMVMWETRDHSCYYTTVNFRPRIEMPAPWMHAKIQNIPLDAFLPVESKSPSSAHFFGSYNQVGFVDNSGE